MPERTALVIVTAVAASLVSGAVTQAAGFLYWGGRLITRIDQLERLQHEQTLYISALEDRGTRSMPLLQQQVIDVRERVERIVQALDSNYNLINEHLRGHNSADRRLDVTDERLKAITERLTALENAYRRQEGR